MASKANPKQARYVRLVVKGALVEFLDVGVYWAYTGSLMGDRTTFGIKFLDEIGITTQKNYELDDIEDMTIVWK